MSVFHFLYYCSVAYLSIAAVIYVITMLAILLDKEKRFFNEVAGMSRLRGVQIFTAIVSPIILALGWVFLFPFKAIISRWGKK